MYKILLSHRWFCFDFRRYCHNDFIWSSSPPTRVPVWWLSPILRTCKCPNRNMAGMIATSTSTLQQSSQPHFVSSPGTTSSSWSLPKLDRLLFLHTSHSLKLFKVPRRVLKKLLRQKGTFSWSQGSRPIGTIKEAPKLSYHRNKDFQSVSWGLDHTQFRAEDLRIFHFSSSTLLKKKVFRTCIEGWQGSSGATKELWCQAC